ncbi:guanylate kinase [Lacibacter sp. H407]|uniref:guanylate kinase n=1 Tax=Lacibacter sp. H407 TaxID=3133423 RepID=UPI0030BAA517
MEQVFHKIIIITAPSGAGKTSITKQLMKHFPQLAFSISAATRAKRKHEQDGVDYHFMSVEEFQQKIHENAFMEWEMVYEGNYYGTLKSEMERIWSNGQIPVLDIDVKGAIHVQDLYPKQILTIFIEPPSIDELKRRLESRGTETADSLQARINKASYEISFKHSFQHVIVNDDLPKAVAEAIRITGGFLAAP